MKALQYMTMSASCSGTVEWDEKRFNMTTTYWACGCGTSFLLVHHFLFYTNVHLLSDNVCEVGMPQVTSLGEQVFCGRGPNREDCKAGYKCNIHPTDRYAVCCRKGTLQQFTIH